MKRIQMCKKVNRNNNSFNHIRRKASHINTVSPEILVGQIWLQDDEPTPVEIIELNTSDEFDPSPHEVQVDHFDHAWSYAHNERLQQIEDNYKINKKARERRRMNQENHFLSSNTNNYFNNKNHYSDNAGRNIEESKLINHQVNCFTIINKHFDNSDTSSDGEFADVEIITSNDIIMDPNNRNTHNKPYDEEIITYDPELDNETRTIWIYSFKNKHLLTEDDFEFSNTAVKETSSCSTSCSIESDEELTKDKSTNIRRVGSPIPPTYIPRLNLSLAPTLSTVTEVSEPNKQPSSKGSHKSLKTKFQKPRNSWFKNESEKLDSGRSIRKLEKSTNIVNWMALSPREKRRRSREPGDKWEGSLLKLEQLPIEELMENNQQYTINDKSGQDNTFRLQVDVDVHVSVNEKSPEKRSLGTPTSADITVKSITDEISSINKIKHAEVNLKACAQDRGDHDRKFDQSEQILCVTKPVSPIVTGPLQTFDEPLKIDVAAWAREERDEKETASYDYLTNKLECVSDEKDGADILWMKNNIPLLKPSGWHEYLPITESQFSLHLSIATIVEERQSWFKRLIKYMNCCNKIK